MKKTRGKKSRDTVPLNADLIWTSARRGTQTLPAKKERIGLRVGACAFCACMALSTEIGSWIITTKIVNFTKIFLKYYKPDIGQYRTKDKVRKGNEKFPIARLPCTVYTVDSFVGCGEKTGGVEGQSRNMSSHPFPGLPSCFPSPAGANVFCFLMSLPKTFHIQTFDPAWLSACVAGRSLIFQWKWTQADLNQPYGGGSFKEIELSRNS